MNDWVNLHALWRIVVLGLLAGAGLPAVFAVGLRALSRPGPAGQGDGTGAVEGNRPHAGAAALCFVIVLASIAWGIYSIVHGA